MNQLTAKKFLNDQELAQLLRLCKRHQGTRDSILIRFALYTGARGCEILKVRKSDLENGTVSLFGAKGSNNRTLPLPDEFYIEVVDYCKAQQDEDLLFPVAIRTFRWIWSQFRPNQQLGLHSLRHTFGVKLYMNSRDVHLCKTALGHKNIDCTLIYVSYIESLETMKIATKGMFDVAK